METSLAQNLSKLTQPAPSTSKKAQEETLKETEKKQPKITKYPHVGVVEVPKISKTPMSDTIEIKKQENPYKVYRLSGKKYSILNFHTLASITVVIFGTIAAPGLKKK